MRRRTSTHPLSMMMMMNPLHTNPLHLSGQTQELLLSLLPQSITAALLAEGAGAGASVRWGRAPLLKDL